MIFTCAVVCYGTGLGELAYMEQCRLIMVALCNRADHYIFAL